MIFNQNFGKKEIFDDFRKKSVAKGWKIENYGVSANYSAFLDFIRGIGGSLTKP